ncbi:MAG: hypothetical protein PHQ14_01610 [Chromatiales bacterium]|jgi:hypothetical protein|nr:hypothetical protein [Chromatiales bacterium]MDX9767710.1 hypothetical protein [Ectothiorhodospiraceae bacterium]
MIPSLAAASQYANLPARLDALAEDQSRMAEMLDRMDQEMESDVDYQILRKTLSFDESAPSEPSAASGGDAAAPEIRTASAPTQSLENSSFRLEIESERTTTLSIDATVSGPDGEFRIRLEAVHHERFSLRLEAQQEVRKSDPLILDLDGNGIQTTGVDDGVRFDLTGDGRQEQVSFVAGNDAFLALDRNGNGSIDNGKELFGDQHGAAHGFAELAKFDDNGDGVIDAGDAAFSKLRLFSLNEDGSQNLRGLEDAGIRAIHLDHDNTNIRLNAYDTIAQNGRYEREDGGIGQAADVLLGYRAVA